MHEIVLNFISDYLSIIEVLKLFEVFTFQPSVQIVCSERDIHLLFEEKKKMQFDLLVKYLIHSISGINSPSFAIFRAIDIFKCLHSMQYYYSDILPTSYCSFGKDVLFITNNELELLERNADYDGPLLLQNSYDESGDESGDEPSDEPSDEPGDEPGDAPGDSYLLEDATDTYVESTVINDIFFNFVASIQYKRDCIITKFINKYLKFNKCSKDTLLNYEEFCIDFDELKNFLYFSDCLIITYLTKVNPESIELTLLRANRHFNISTYEKLPFHYYYGIPELILKKIFTIVSSVNSLNFWKKYNVFQTLFEKYEDYSTSEKKDVIDQLGSFLFKFYEYESFMKTESPNLFKFEGKHVFNINMFCFNSVIVLKSCNGTRETEEFPPAGKIIKWTQLRKRVLQEEHLRDELNIQKSEWIIDKTHIQIGRFIEGCQFEIACLNLPGICSMTLKRPLLDFEKIKLGSFVAHQFKRVKICKGWKIMDDGEYKKFNMYDCSEKTYNRVKRLCEYWCSL